MFKALLIVSLISCSASLYANIESPSLTIGSEARCVQSSGIPIKEVPDNEVRLACLKDRGVQEQCNPDGSHARHSAFREWVSQIEDFKQRCSSVGGVFAYANSDFKEPANASFCSTAQPEVSYNNFEEPLCNFVSRCPQVAVTCLRPEETLVQATQHAVSLPGIPNPIQISF